MATGYYDVNQGIDYTNLGTSSDLDNAVDYSYLNNQTPSTGSDNIYDPGQSTGGGGEPGVSTETPTPVDTTMVGPGGEDLSTSKVYQHQGKWYNTQGELLYDPGSSESGIMGFLNKAFGTGTANKIKSMFVDDKGNVNLGTLAGIAGGIYGLTGGNKPTTGGYKGSIPQLAAVRQEVAQPQYVPYSGQPTMGRRYFSDVNYVGAGDTAGIEAAKKSASEQAGILANYQPNVAKPKEDTAKAATGLAGGGIARYLRGGTDGMADKIDTSIDDKQAAKLSHGEFVIPADVVSHLGNGNSDAGANVLYKMMDKVRKARTGTVKQGKRINPDKFTPGGIAAYATGGTVKFDTGGSTSATAPTAANPYGGTTEQSLAPWVGDYVTNMLGKAQALSSTPYQAYQGPLSAGYSPLQQQAFQGASSLGGSFDANAAAQYMNPYIQQTLNPQLQAMQRQADTQRGILGAQASKFGAFGGARSGLMNSQLNADLMRQQQQATGQAYQTAYDKAMGQYNIAKQQKLADLTEMANLGATQRGIEQEGITAGMKAFEQEREDPYNKLKFQQSMLSGLPLSSTYTTPNMSPLQQLGLTGDQVTKLYDMLNKWMNPTATASTTTTPATTTTTTPAKP